VVRDGIVRVGVVRADVCMCVSMYVCVYVFV